MRSRLAVLPLIALLACLLAATQASAASPSGVVISLVPHADRGLPVRRVPADREHDCGAAVDLSGWRLYDCYTSGGKLRVSGPTANRCRSGSVLPAGKGFVFGKDGGDYTGTADATYHYQVTESGRLPTARRLRHRKGRTGSARRARPVPRAPG